MCEAGQTIATQRNESGSMRIDGAGAPCNTPRKASGRMRLTSKQRVDASPLDSASVAVVVGGAEDQQLRRPSAFTSRTRRRARARKKEGRKSAENEGSDGVFDE